LLVVATDLAMFKRASESRDTNNLDEACGVESLAKRKVPYPDF
jgi:hypothetical protein